MRWPYPAPGVDPWYDAFEGLVSAQDASAFSVRETQNIILTGGGVISWTASTSTLTWAAPITLNSSTFGFQESLPAGSAVLPNDGDFGYVTYISGTQENVTLSLTVSSLLPSSDANRPVILFRRRGAKIFFRNGAVLDDGDSAQIIDEGPGATAGNIATFSLTAAEPLTVGNMVAVNASGLALKADCTVAGRFPALGVCTVAAGTGANATIQCIGPATVFLGMTPGTTYYLGTAGGISTAPPGGALVSHPAVLAYSATAGILLTSNLPVTLP